MPEQKLIEKLATLDQMIQLKKTELAAKIMPLVHEFTQETGLLVRSIEPGYVETTSMDDRLREFTIGYINSAIVHTDVGVRGIRNRTME